MLSAIVDRSLRGIALFLGSFTALNLFTHLVLQSFDATILWLGIDRYPSVVIIPFQVVLSLFLIRYGLGYVLSSSLRYFFALLLATTTCITLVDSAAFFYLSEYQTIDPSISIPLSLIVGILCTMMAVSLFFPFGSSYRVNPITSACVASLFGLLFPLLQIGFFGTTDYRRPADAIVVFGAKAFEDGRPSLPLADRVRMSCELYDQGYCDLIIFSGGPGEGRVSEAESMRQFAMSHGVDSADILIDNAGYSTYNTVLNCDRLCKHLGLNRVIAVSQPYHIPRIKLMFNQIGRNVYTVPAEDRSAHGLYPVQLAREVLAFWAYYLQDVLPLRS